MISTAVAISQGLKSIIEITETGKMLYNYFIPKKKSIPLLNLNTGDIILFRGQSLLSRSIEYFSSSMYSHVGIVLKNPNYLVDRLSPGNNMEDGYYILESTFDGVPDVENKNIKVGVQIHDLEYTLENSVPGTVYIRKVDCVRDEKFKEKLIAIHDKIHNIPYDLKISDWIRALKDLNEPLEDIKEKSTKDSNQFWCSALVAYVLEELGIIEPNLPFEVIAPKDFSSFEGNRIKFLCPISEDELLF